MMARLSRGPTLQKVMDRTGTFPFRDLETLPKRLGFVHARSKGSHEIHVHPKVPRPLSIQPKGREAKRYQQFNQLRDMIREFDLLDD